MSHYHDLNLPFTIEFSFTPTEFPTITSPGCDAEWEITGVYLDYHPTKDLLEIPFPKEGPAYDFLLTLLQKDIANQEQP